MVQIGSFGRDKIAGRIASARINDMAAAGATIETDSNGPSLWRKAVLAGMVALASFTAVAPAAAATFNAPPQSISASFLADANDAAARTVATWAGGRLAQITVEERVGLGSNFQLDMESKGVFWADKVCHVHHATPAALKGMYGGLLNVPVGTDLSSIEKARGIMDCVSRAFLDRSEIDKYDRNEGRTAPVTDVLMVVASVRHGPEAYETMSKFEMASALAMLTSGNPGAQSFGRDKLQALGALDGYLKAKPGAVNLIKEASLPDLVKVANAFTRTAQGAAAKSEAPISSYRSHDLATIADTLSSAGLRAAGHAAKMGLSTGLVNGKTSVATTRPDDPCSRIDDWQMIKEKQRQKFCYAASKFSESVSSVADDFGPALEARVDTMLREAAPQASAQFR